MKEKILPMTNKKFLNGITLLNTRPLLQAKELDTQIKLLGGKSINFPTIEIVEPQDLSILQASLKRLHNYDIAIFVSANAVEACFKQLKTWPDSLAILCIGPGTANVLKKYDKQPNVLPDEYNSEGLLKLDILQSVTNKQIALFCGENTRPFLSDELKNRGATVEQIICYRRQKPQIDYNKAIAQLKKNKIECIITTSPENLSNLYDIFQAYDLNWLRQIPILVISEKMASMAEEYQWNSPALIAENATSEAIIHCLIKHYR